ncbi:MAG: C4-dicarboxylate ABC transporter substrate-binding protein, partial [Burkholderiaceae bacterium]|nr:C4-dicarboxylate ABC transporter substrate-binding protein [Burkholderiaceae bacterium]
MRNMTQSLKYSLISAKEMLLSAGPLALIAALLIAFAFWKLNPTPPKQVSLATGPAQSAYEEFGKRYAHQLRANGVEVKLVPSEGSQANLALLKERKVDLAFVQGGSLEAGTVDDYELESLGSLFVEPVWLFYRDESARRAGRGKDGRLDSLAQLRAMRINIGAAGSGVPNLMTRLLDVNHID